MMGDAETLQVTLQPGRYSFLCDVVEDYEGHRIVHSAEACSAIHVS
jgi:hypothetical protein